MKVTVNLVSAPWADPRIPSVQLGALHAHLERTLPPRVEVATCSAHLEIPLRAWGDRAAEEFERHQFHGEHVFFLAFWERHLRHRPGLEGPAAGLLELVEAANEAVEKTRMWAGLGGGSRLTAETVERLQRAGDALVDEELIPRLDPEALNLIGFTLNYDQVWASLALQARLRRRAPGLPLAFLFGGACAAYPHVVEVLAAVGEGGLAFVGEGERRLELLVRTLLASPDPPSPEAANAAAESIPGVFDLLDPPDLHREPAGAEAGHQVGFSLEASQARYDEYFDRLPTSFRPAARLPVEGTRGCFAKCDFCGLNHSFAGFRRRDASRVWSEVERLRARHGVSRIQFLDNVCDTWADGLARLALADGGPLRMFMELRVHHPEDFWVRLARAGLDEVQIGLEALSGPLLRAMAKGTRVIQNLRVLKVLRELEVSTIANLITHHPRSTLDDVIETRRVLERIDHLGPLNPVEFFLVVGSPLYATLSEEERRRSRPKQALRLDGPLGRLTLNPMFAGLDSPPSLRLPETLTRAWDELGCWYRERLRSTPRGGELAVISLAPDSCFVIDRRCGKPRERRLTGLEAGLYAAGHRGPRVDRVAAQLGADPVRVREALEALDSEGLILRVEDHYLSLALRPRRELLAAPDREDHPEDAALAGIDRGARAANPP